VGAARYGPVDGASVPLEGFGQLRIAVMYHVDRGQGERERKAELLEMSRGIFDQVFISEITDLFREDSASQAVPAVQKSIGYVSFLFRNSSDDSNPDVPGIADHYKCYVQRKY